MIFLPGEFQRAPWSMAPVPSNIGWRLSAIRNARCGTLRGQAIDDASHNFLGLASAQLRQRRVEWSASSHLRVRRREKVPGIIAVAENVLRHGDHTSEPFGPLAFRET